MATVFISYRRKDSAHPSSRIYDQFVESFGKPNVYKDIDTIRAGRDFRQEIQRMASNCNLFVAVIGPQWVGEDPVTGIRRIDDPGDFVRLEIEFALTNNKPIIPLFIDGMTAEKLAPLLPESLKELLYSNGFIIHEDPYFKQGVELVVRRIRADFPSEHELEEQRIRERTEQLEREKKIRDEQFRLERLEADKATRERTEQLEYEKKKRDEQLYLERLEAEKVAREQNEQAILAQRAAEQQAILLQKEAEKRELEYKEKAKQIEKQKGSVYNPAGVFGLISIAGLGIYSAINFDRYIIHSAGGVVLLIIICAILGIFGGIVGVVTGFASGLGLVSSNVVSASITFIAMIGGAVFLAMKFDQGSNTFGLVAGLILGNQIVGAVVGFIASIISDTSKDISPWYIRDPTKRIVLEKISKVNVSTNK